MRSGHSQRRYVSSLRPQYDVIVCGAGSSGAVVAGRLAEKSDITVLLIEAGGDDTAPGVTQTSLWPTNLGSERDWGFRALPNPNLNGRSLPMSMGKVLGGGSAINVMVWARGHRTDWDRFAAESGDPAWGYDSVLDIYRRIEDWHGLPDPHYRGTGGPVFVAPAPEPSPLAPAAVSAAGSLGVPIFDHPNGRMMEGHGGAAISDIRSQNGKRQSVFASYVYPHLERPNLTVLTGATVTRLTLERNRATGVEIYHQGTATAVRAEVEVVLSLGAIHTPKVLMYSGIGDAAELTRWGIPVRQHLPGVGRNFQDHVGLSCVWENRLPLPPRNNSSESTVYWALSDSDTPDIFICQIEVPFCSDETAARFGVPPSGWSLFGGLAHPKSRGRLRLTGPDPLCPIDIDANTFGDPADIKTAVRCVEFCREIANSGPLHPFVRREVMPGNLIGRNLEEFVRDAALTYWHQSASAKMGMDSMSVVDGALRVYGIENLRIADASIMPAITTGNTMAPCVVIGERAAEMLIAGHGL
jgi:choline dehydrogenase